MGGRPVIVMNTAYDLHNGRECDILIGAYAERVYESGGDPLLLPAIEDRAFYRRSLASAQGVLLIGGKDYPPSFYGEEPHPRTNLSRMRSECDLWFGECALASSLPVFGICAGCQLLAILDGGKLIQHLDNADDVHTAGKSHSATVVADGWLSSILHLSPGDDFTVNSFHREQFSPSGGAPGDAEAFRGDGAGLRRQCGGDRTARSRTDGAGRAVSPGENGRPRPRLFLRAHGAGGGNVPAATCRFE